MNKIVTGLLSFTAGIFIGGLVTKKYMEKKYELLQEEYNDLEHEDYYEPEDNKNINEVDNENYIDNDDIYIEEESGTFEEFFESETGTKYNDYNPHDDDYQLYEILRKKYDLLSESVAKSNYEAAHYNDDVPHFDESPRYNGRDDSLDDIVTPIDPIIDPADEPYFIEEEEYEILDGWDSEDYTLFADGYVTDSCGIPVDNDEIDMLFGTNFHTRFEREGADLVWIRNEKLRMDFSIAKDNSNFEDVAPNRIRRMMGI